MIKVGKHRRTLLRVAAPARIRRLNSRMTRARSARVPQTMRAAAINRFGGPEVLWVHVLAVPKIGPREVLIALDTAGVGSWDAEMRAGWLPDGKRPRFPLVLGTDGAGLVAAVGSKSAKSRR